MARLTADQYNVVDGTSYHPETPQGVINALERLRTVQKTCRVFMGDTETGIVWPEENEVYGLVGRSTGPIKAPLLVHPQSIGGPALLDHCILGIISGPDAWEYKHPQMNLGLWEQNGCEVWHNGEFQSQHRDAFAAARYLAFMTGKRLTK